MSNHQAECLALALLLLAPGPFARAAHHPKALAAGAARTNPKDRAVMVYVPAGPFLMGDADQRDNPRHKVALDAFRMYKNDVTEAQYRKFCQATGRQMPRAPEWGWKNERPVVNVTWIDVKAYCDWAGLALPTEAQWEKADRFLDTTGRSR
jgi:formylglycine-generating enzyme required for sulfatase activity